MRQRDFATVELKEEDSLPLPLSPPPSFLSFSPVIASFSYQRWGRGGKTARNMSERLVNAERNVAKMQNYCMLQTRLSYAVTIEGFADFPGSATISAIPESPRRVKTLGTYYFWKNMFFLHKRSD